MTNNAVPNYFAYLVRLWRADGQSVWRATLQDPHTGHQLRFDSIESLFTFFQKQLGGPAGVEPPTSDRPNLEQNLQ